MEDITEALWGSKVSPATISELNKKAYVHIEDWRNRPLQGGRYPYVYVDGIYLRRNWGGEYENMAILVAIAVAELRAMKLKEAAKKVEDGIEETLTYCDFPSEHWARIRTNNVIERLNREIRQRTRVVGTFPDGNSALMLACARLRHDHPLKGLVRCGNCKRAMTRRKNKAGIRYFQCIHSVNNGNTDCPVGRSFPEMDIEKVVFHALTQFLALAQKEAIQNREVGDLRKSAIKECADKIRTLQKQNEQHKASKLRLYEKYAAGSITKEAYIQQKAAADVKIAENDGVIQRSHERMKELDSETACSDEKLDAVCEQYADCKALTYELTHAFISAVYIYDLDNIEIVWKFKDFLTTSEGEAK